MSMSKSDNGEGVAANRARKRRLWSLILSMAAIGVAIDAVLIPIARSAPPGGPQLPATLAIVAATILVLMLTGGVWLNLRIVDELDRQHNLAAFSIGFIFNLGAYVAWSLLWAGGVAPKPDAYVLFVSSAAAAVAAYCWMKLRTDFG